MKDFEKKYFLFAVILVLLNIGMILIIYPLWKGSWFFLLIGIIIEVTAFISNFRQAYEKKDTTYDNYVNQNISNKSIKNVNISFEKSSGGVDDLTSTIGYGSVPFRPSIIIGRDNDINLLKNKLLITNNAKRTLQRATIIIGWPGVGKTTIASALAYDSDLVNFYQDGVLWTSLGPNPNIQSELAVWGHQLGTEEIVKAKTPKEAQNRLSNIIREKKYLIIVDDVWKAEDAIPFIVGGPKSATVITTRLNLVANSLAPIPEDIHRLDVLKDDDAFELIVKLAPSVVTKNPKECLNLVKELEGLPLALQVAGRLLNTEAKYGFDVIELINEIREGARLLKSKAPVDRIDLETETSPTIAALLLKSLDKLDDVTRECFAYLGVFAPKPATFDIEVLKYIWQLDNPKRIIKNLVDRGLLEYIPEIKRYQIHAVLVMLARSLLTNNGTNN